VVEESEVVLAVEEAAGTEGVRERVEDVEEDGEEEEEGGEGGGGGRRPR
jgi:DUF1009 family protein